MPAIRRHGRPIVAVAFDCFGTLANFVDDHFIDTFDKICGAHSLDVAGKGLWDHWLEEGKRLWEERGRDPKDPLSGPEPEFLTYRHAWSVQFDRSFAALGGAGEGIDACSRLLDQISEAACFPEVTRVLETLRGTYRIAVLSNADEDFLTSFLARSGLEFGRSSHLRRLDPTNPGRRYFARFATRSASSRMRSSMWVTVRSRICSELVRPASRWRG